MLSSHYVEDIFLEFYDLIHLKGIRIETPDLTALTSFYNIVVIDNPLTQNQGNFLLKILRKYQPLYAKLGYDYAPALVVPTWKTPFRIIDLSKKIWIEKTEDKKVIVCIKFPYQIKNEFDHEFKDINSSTWDHERKMRFVSLYDCNLIQLHDFVSRHNFEIDDSFLITLGEVEEIWQTQDKIVPYCEILDNVVQLKNCNEDTGIWWNEHCTNDLEHDLLLAKSMGFTLKETPTTLVEKIAHSKANQFWLKTNSELFSLYKSVNGKMCIVLDRVGDTKDWLQKFVNDADTAGITRTDIKVCFRADKDEDQTINTWIKDQGLGGKVEEGKILIFNHKPAKWLFKEQDSVKIVVSNNLYPSTNMISRDWFESHPCVIYLGDIKPSEARKQKIVEL